MGTAQPVEPGPREGERKQRSRRALVAALLAWALVATGIAGWMSLEPREPSQNDVWGSNGRALGQLARDVLFVASDTSRYLSTLDGNWTWDALNWTVTSEWVTQDAIASPGGFALGGSLGFNATAMCAAAYGYEYLVFFAAHAGQNYSSVFQAAAFQMDIYRNLSARLSDFLYLWSEGMDPLAAIGAANVTAVQALMATLWRLNIADIPGYGPIVSLNCGI